MKKNNQNLKSNSKNSIFYFLFSKFSVIFLLSTFYFLLSAFAAQAASLYFSPASGSYEVGKTFSVNVYISSADQAMNAASGVIAFPRDKLEVTALSKSGSIFSLWVQEPSFSNSSGAINFEGIVLNPGFSGSGGKIMTVTFKAKAAGQATINFSSGSILANDGAGTNILGGLGSGSYQLATGPASQPAPAESQPTPTTGVPATPQVISVTHPDSNKWYNNKNPQFSWVLPAGVTGVSIYFSQSPSSNPGPASDGLLNAKSYKDVADGIWYFHLKFRNARGWGPIAHFKIQIDTTPPAPLTIKFIDGKETENPQPTIIFNTADSLSGLDYYKVKIGEGEAFNLTAEELKNNLYTLPLQAPGTRNILVQTFDKAGNYSLATEEFTIKPLAQPIFTDYPTSLASGENLIIAGESQAANTKINFWLQQENNEPQNFILPVNQAGKFSFVSEEKLKDGVYKFWAEAVDARGARSLPTDKIAFVVAQSTFWRLGNWAISFLAVIIPLMALIILLVAVLWWGWHKLALLRKQLRQEVGEAESTLHQAFDLLRREARQQIKILEGAGKKRQLTKEEEAILKKWRNNLDQAEKIIKKEIKDIARVIGKPR